MESRQPSDGKGDRQVDGSGISLKLDSGDSNVAKLQPEYQKFITDAEPLEEVFLRGLCGYRVKYETRPNAAARVMGIAKDEQIKIRYIDKYARLMNEAGASYLYNTFYPLVNQLSSTSNMSENELFNMWNGAIDSVNEALLDGVIDDNVYEYKTPRHSDVIAFLCKMYVVGLKSRKGFTLTKLAESFMTIFKGDASMMPRKEGFIDSIKKGMGGLL